MSFSSESSIVCIGDVHGCFEELTELLAMFDVTSTKFYFVGDLINKGPSSRKVLEIVRQLPYKSIVAGNHEDNFLNKKSKRGIFYDLGGETLATQEEIGFLSTAKPLDCFSRGDQDYLVIHGGMYPAYLETYGRQLWQICPTTGVDKDAKKKADRWSRTTMARWIDPVSGQMLSLAEAATREDKYFWADKYYQSPVYQYREDKPMHILFGHMPVQLLEFPSYELATPTDWGCVYGYELCAFEYNNSSVRRHSVQAKAAYADLRTN